MRLLVYSYFPLLSDHQAGGAQFAMRETLLGMAKSGMEVTVICPETKDPDILSHDGIRVMPVLKEKKNRTLLFHERAQNLDLIAKAAENCDVIWTLDAPFPLPAKQPIVLTLQTVAYEDELNSFWNFNWDVVVPASDYLRSVIETVIEPGYRDGPPPPPVKTILNGIDTDYFAPTSPAPLLEKFGLPDAKYILFPHRPEAAKGFDTALLVLKLLIEKGRDDYKLMIPVHPSSIKSCLAKERRFYSRLYKKVDMSGLSSSIVFHPWICLPDLPSYYSLGESCLMLSALPEGFGFTTIQSISCGTPVISTRSGSLRERLPAGHGVTYVNVGEVEPIADAILDGPSRREVERGREFVRSAYSIDRYIREYADCFRTARKYQGSYSPPVNCRRPRLAPWCYRADPNRIWHDLEMRYFKLTDRERLALDKLAENSEDKAAEEYPEEIEKLLKTGILSFSA